MIDKVSGEIDISGEALSDKVIGYFAYIRTTNGFSKTMYWSVEKATNHAERYSKAYQSWKQTGRGGEIWMNNTHEMFQKSVLKALLSKYGVLSIELQQAVNYENADAADAAIVDDTPFPPPPIPGDGSVDAETGEITPAPLLTDAAIN